MNDLHKFDVTDELVEVVVESYVLGWSEYDDLVELTDE